MLARIENKYNNHPLDDLVRTLDSVSVLSKRFKRRILTIIEFVGTIGGREADEAREQISNLRYEMGLLSVFSNDFINLVNMKLTNGLRMEILKVDKTNGSKEKDL